MLYVTGDCHARYDKLTQRRFPIQKEMDKDDYVLICGDFGYWDESASQEYVLNELTNRSFTTLFVDGNHENFDLLNSKYPVEEWHGGKVHKLRDSVIHLMRGQVYLIDGKKIFTFGGARSHDISDGIIEMEGDWRKKCRELDKNGAAYRVNHLEWWKEEMPSLAEMEEGRKNLKAVNNEVDYIFTHCGPISSVIEAGLNFSNATDELTKYLEEIKNKTVYREWYFGHYHYDLRINSKETILYYDMLRLW